MKNKLKTVCALAGICLGIVLTGTLAWWLTGGVGDVRRAREFSYQEFSRYHNGSIKELRSLQAEFTNADGKQQKSLGDIVYIRTIEYDLDKLPGDIRVFIGKLRAERFVLGDEVQLE